MMLFHIGNEGNWKWAHDHEALEPAASAFWRPGRPNNKTANGDDCVVMVLGSRAHSTANASRQQQHDFSWEDTSCLVPTIHRQFDVAPICQRDVGETSVASVQPKASRLGEADF
jgi:hypothetical protein